MSGLKFNTSNSKLLFWGDDKLLWDCCCSCSDCASPILATLATDVPDLTGVFGLGYPYGGHNGCSWYGYYGDSRQITMAVINGNWELWLPAYHGGTVPYIRWRKTRADKCDFVGSFTQVAAENCTGGTCVVSIP